VVGLGALSRKTHSNTHQVAPEAHLGIFYLSTDLAAFGRRHVNGISDVMCQTVTTRRERDIH